MFIKKAQYDHILRFINIAAPAKKEIEVFGREFEGNLSSERFPSIMIINILYQYST